MDDGSHSHANLKKGILYVLISCIFFTAVVAFSSIVSAKTPVPLILFFQNVVCLLAVLPWIIRTGIKSLHLSKIGLLSLRTFAGFLNYALVYLAVRQTSLVNVILLSNTAPLFIPIMIWMWKGVTIHRGLWMSLILGFCGIGLILQPGWLGFNWGNFLALGAGFCIAISTITQRRLVKSVPINTILFYYFLMSIFLSFPFALETWSPIHLKDFSIIFLMGIFLILARLLFTYGLKYGKPSVLSSFTYSSVVYGVLIEWIFWGQLPSWLSVTGIVIVCVGGILTIRYSGGKGIGPPSKDRASR